MASAGKCFAELQPPDNINIASQPHKSRSQLSAASLLTCVVGGACQLQAAVAPSDQQQAQAGCECQAGQ